METPLGSGAAICDKIGFVFTLQRLNEPYLDKLYLRFEVSLV